MKKYFLVLCAVASLGFTACPSSNNQVAAVIDGKPIYNDELDSSGGGRIAQQIYSMRKNALDNLIETRILEQAAAKKGITVDAMMKEEVDSKVTEPTDEEIKAVYESNKERFGDNFDAVKGQIAGFLKQNRKNVVKDQFLAKLKQETKIENKLVSPPVQKVVVSVDDDSVIGPENAKVTIVEFSDYQCPFCGRARATITKVLETYKDKVRYVFRDFPLSFHQDAFAAHVASDCAKEQGKYWEYNKLLFESQTALKPDKLKAYAKGLGLDTKQFDECLDSNKYASEVQKDMDDAAKVGVTGTPSFFINGIMISGAQPFEKFKEIIDAELKK
ncbi:MAG: thioredoxin domain-containing protein [Deltaproteobacteria bacterium]|nr:thioredoxin domain-containing protein [Deltaproteobacteria bacterium]